MTQPEIVPQSPRLLVNTLNIMLMIELRNTQSAFLLNKYPQTDKKTY